MDFIDELLIY